MKLSVPIISTERCDILDVLRGFALLGISLDNIVGFTGYGFFSMKKVPSVPTFIPDAAMGRMELTFVNGFYFPVFVTLRQWILHHTYPE